MCKSYMPSMIGESHSNRLSQSGLLEEIEGPGG